MKNRRSAPAGAAPPTSARGVEQPGDPLERLYTTTYRVTRADWLALKRAAEDVTVATGRRTDASAVLREVLQGWRLGSKKVSSSTRRKP